MVGMQLVSVPLTVVLHKTNNPSPHPTPATPNPFDRLFFFFQVYHPAVDIMSTCWTWTWTWTWSCCTCWTCPVVYMLPHLLCTPAHIRWSTSPCTPSRTSVHTWRAECNFTLSREYVWSGKGFASLWITAIHQNATKLTRSTNCICSQYFCICILAHFVFTVFVFVLELTLCSTPQSRQCHKQFQSSLHWPKK